MIPHLDLAVDQYMEAKAQLMSGHREAKECNPSKLRLNDIDICSLV